MITGKKTKRWVWSAGTLLLAAALLTGCSQDDGPDIDGDPTAVAFSAAPSTRTTGGGDSWAIGDKVGIFMLTTGGSLTTSAQRLVDNKQYNVLTAGASSALTPADGTPIYYPQSGNVDFVAYYPYGTAGTGAGQITTNYKYNITVAGQDVNADAQNALDVLYAKADNGGSGYTKTKTAVALAFGHVLSKITLNITLGDGMDGLNGSDITATVFSWMPQTATLDLQDGTLTAGATGDFSALKAGTPLGGAAATFTALLVPQPQTGTGDFNGRTAVFTVSGKKYTWTIPNGETFAAGNHYTYPVEVKLNGVTVGTPTIADWNKNDNGSGEAEKLPIELVRIPAGTFLMGSSNGSNINDGDGTGLNTTPAEPNRENNETQHKVTLTEDFWMGKYPVTFDQYDAFCNATSRNKPSDNSWGRGDRPVINVSWNDAVAYCAWLTETFGGTWTLPTEAQWEYACRGGKENQPFGIGTGYVLDNTLANFYWLSMWSWNGSDVNATISDYGSYPGKTQEVGSYISNTWGLYDMHGNVYEWCSDWHGNYDSNPATDPTGPGSGSDRVLRGGYWRSYAQGCRSAYRDRAYPGFASYGFGFRVVFVP